MAGPLIIRLILAGVPAAKLIAKYGKKLYNKAKADIKESDKIDIANKELMKTSTLLKASAGTSVIAAVVKAVEKKLKKKEKKLEKNKGGSVNSRAIAKKYFKGG